jgi:uncharacterized protein YqfB (UPF0267 family)
MRRKILFVAVIWIAIAGVIFILYLLREVSPVKEFIAWALHTWVIIAAIGGVGVGITAWVIKHDFSVNAKEMFAKGGEQRLNALYGITPILQKMDGRIRYMAKQEAKKVIDVKEYEKVNKIINKDILNIKPPKPTTIKGLERSVRRQEIIIADKLKNEMKSIRPGIEKLESISSYLDSKGFGLKQQREHDKKYLHLASQLQDYRNLPLDTEINDLIRLHNTCSEISGNMLLAQIRALQFQVKGTTVRFTDVISAQTQAISEQLERNMSEMTSNIRARISECIRELEINQKT